MLIVGVIDFLATAVLIKPVLLLMSIPMDRQLRCWRQFRQLIMAPRGGLLPKVTLGGHAPPVTIGLTDQSGEFCNGVAFSVGLETFISHSDCSESSCAEILTRKRSITTTRADADDQFQSTMNLKCCHGEIAGVDARCQSPLDRPSTKLINRGAYKPCAWPRERRRQRALTVPIHIFGRLIALFATKPSRGLAMIDS